jgi:cell division protein FtsN
MKLLVAGVVLAIAASTAAEAFPLFHRPRSTDKLPKPIDSPIVRPKAREDHKVGKRAGRHPSKVQRQEWGTEWQRTLSLKRAHPVPDYLSRTE